MPRSEYLALAQESYFKARANNENTQLLDEYCGDTGQSRK